MSVSAEERRDLIRDFAFLFLLTCLGLLVQGYQLGVEDQTIYPALAKAIGGDDPTAALSRTHREIFHLIRLYRRLTDGLATEGSGPDELRDIRRVLYSIYAILDLHMAQEEELYLSLGDEHPPGETGTPPPDERPKAA